MTRQFAFCCWQFEGEIQVLEHVTVLPSLSGKKFGAKELVLKPGETLDVIVKAVDGKLICRNEEGKCKSELTADF